MKTNKFYKVQLDEFDMPNFKTTANANYFAFTEVETLKPYIFRELKFFINKYGPKPVEIENYYRKLRIKEDIKVDFIIGLRTYWYENREKMKQRSQLHYYILLEKDRKTEIALLITYFKKYKASIYKK